MSKEEEDLVEEEDKDEDYIPDYDNILNNINKEKEEVEQEAYDYAKFYEDVILTHSDFEPTPLSELVPDDVFESFKAEAIEYEHLEEAIEEYDRIMAESINELGGTKFPEIIEDDVLEPGKEKEPVHKVPGGIVGRLFTVRKKGWKDKIWEVTPGGAKSGDEIREIPDEMVNTIASSKGYVVLSGKDYSIITQTKPNEKKLVEEWREKREGQKKKIEDLVDLTDLNIDDIKDVQKIKNYKLDVDHHYIKNLVENIIRYGHERMPEQNPEAFKTIGLAFLSSAIDGKVIIRDGWKDEIYPNLFTVVIGPPSTQKSSAFNTIQGSVKGSIPDIVYHTDWTKEALGAQFQSNPSGMIWKDEFAQILDPEIREGYMRGVLEFLIVIYDENEYSTHRIEESRNIEVQGVNASFTATIQTERFYKLVNEDDVNSGFFNRFCYVILQDRKEPPKQTIYTKETDIHKKKISKAFKEVRGATKHINRRFPVLMDYDEEGIRMLNEWYAELDGHARSYGGIRAMSLVAVISRIYTMAKKAAIIYEVLDRISKDEKLYRDTNNEMPAYQISPDNIQKGIDFANMCYKNAEYLYLRLRSTDVAVKLEKFMDIVKSPRKGSIVIAGKRGEKNAKYGMRRSDLLKNVALKLKDFNDYLNTFLAMERLFVFRSRTSTKARNEADFICTFNPAEMEDADIDGDGNVKSKLLTTLIMHHYKEEKNKEKIIGK